MNMSYFPPAKHYAVFNPNLLRECRIRLLLCRFTFVSACKSNQYGTTNPRGPAEPSAGADGTIWTGRNDQLRKQACPGGCALYECALPTASTSTPVTSNRAPPASLWVAERLHPCAFAMDSTMERPSPVPSSLEE